MNLELPATAKVLGKLLQLGITLYDAWTSEGFESKELESLPALTDLLDELGGKKTGQASDMEALHLSIITRCFGQAFGRHWAFNKSLAPRLTGLRLFMSREERQRAEEVELRMKLAVDALADLGRTGDLPADKEEWKRTGRLASGPLSTPYYQALWNAFTNPLLDDEEQHRKPPLLDLGETGRLEFERHFLLAYHQALSSSVGRPLQSYLERLSSDYRVRLIRELLLKDLAGWSGRHLFGNIERHEWRSEDPVPFMPLGEMYVEPDARLSGEERTAPVTRLIGELIGAQQKRILIIKADFGMGKSLTARTLAQRWAQHFLRGLAPSPELLLPVYIRCAEDLPDEGFNLDQTVRSAWRRQAESLELKLKSGDESLNPPGKEQRAVFLLDGLDEVILGERRLESFFRRIREEASEHHCFIIFSRPGALPADQELKNIPIIELLPWQPRQSEQWLEHWRALKGEGPTWPQVQERELEDFASTPILLFMLTLTWNKHSTQAGTSLVALYEEFFRQIAQGKHEADREQHLNVAEASSELREQLIEEKLLSREADAPDAMLWLMGRVAWEATKLEQRQMLEPLHRAEVLTKRDIENLIVNELGVERNASETIDAIQVGLLLTMQAHLRAGAASQVLFGHKSFREYLVARYWADRLRALAQARPRQWETIEKPLLGGRLLSTEDRTFDFLMQMLNGAPLVERRHSPFGLEPSEREALLEWTQNRFESEEQQDSSGNTAPTVRDDRRPWLREAALAIGSTLTGSQGMRLRDKLTIRSILTWFWLMRVGPILVAPKLRGEGALLSELTLRGADFRGADLRSAHFLNANLEPRGPGHPPCNFSGARLEAANLSGAKLIEAQFDEATLTRASLKGTDLIGASFRKSNLEGVLLAGADLRFANLIGATLRDANLLSSNLSGAMLLGANLQGATLTAAVLTDARYDRATVWPSGFDPQKAGALLVGEEA